MSFRKLLITIISINLFVFSTPAIYSASLKTKESTPKTPYEICTQKNEENKNISLKQARHDYEETVKEALNTRKEAVNYALTFSEEYEQTKLTDQAYTEYKDIQSSAQDEYLALRKFILKKFDIEKRKCRTLNVED